MPDINKNSTLIAVEIIDRVGDVSRTTRVEFDGGTTLESIKALLNIINDVSTMPRREAILR